MSNSIKIKNSTAGGDIAGGNITHNIIQPGPLSALRELAEKFRAECAADERLSEYIERLQHYCAPRRDQPSRDLEEKLETGNRSDLISDALVLKERFTKKLMRLQYSEIAQEIFVHILSR